MSSGVNFNYLGQGSTFFFRLLFIWRGSLYKLLWHELIAYLVVYYIINFTYRFGLNMHQRRTFEDVVRYCDSQIKNIPLSFLLGFFVSGVITRWYQMYMYIPSLNAIAFRLQSIEIVDNCNCSQQLKLTLMRYLNLAWILSMRTISSQIEKRFPGKKKFGIEDVSDRINKSNKLLPTSLATENESNIREMFEQINKDAMVQKYYTELITEKEIKVVLKIGKKYLQDEKRNYIPEYWIPLYWCTKLLNKSIKEKYIEDKDILKDVTEVRKDIMTLFKYSNIRIPLVYTQVVIIATYSYFMLQLISSQIVQPFNTRQENQIDMLFPFLSIINYMFLFGWLKVAMCVLNPYGDDDEDFPISDMLDNNLEVTKRIVSVEHRQNEKNIYCEKHLEGNLINFLVEESDDEENNSKTCITTHESISLEV